MKKPWSISTTVRNPERIRYFLKILTEIEGGIWNKSNQRKFQILLTQNKLYGYGNPQFYRGMSPENLALMDNPDKIDYKKAEKILEVKEYVGGIEMRGRQSFNPIEKMGLAYLDESNKIRISEFGKLFLKEDYDLGDIFFRSFIKLQFPNPTAEDFKKEDGYNIKPFIGTLHLIYNLNKIILKNKEKPVGLKRNEFNLFIPTLINYKDISNYVKEIVHLRKLLNGKNKKQQKIIFEKYSFNFIKKFLNTRNKKDINKTIKNLQEYGDNIIRYLRLTRFFYIRGGGFYIDIEPRRNIEIEKIIESDNASINKFETERDYLEYLSDISRPELPWDNKESLIKIIKLIEQEIYSLSGEKINKSSLERLDIKHLKSYIIELRIKRQEIQDSIIRGESQEIGSIKSYIEQLKTIYESANKALELEKLATLGLNALNDAIKIKPNYPVGDDNNPTFTAPAGKPDIECYYDSYNSICEVTMLKDRSQWYNEGQPVMRHLREFEEINQNKEVYCLFIAPNLHRDTINTFWNSIKYEYEGEKQKIIPLTIKQFIEILEVLLKCKEKDKKFTNKDLRGFYEGVVSIVNEVNNSTVWIEKIPLILSNWKRGF